VKYAFIKDNKHSFKVARMCHLFGVKSQGYYQWAKNQNLRVRSASEQLLKDKIYVIFIESHQTYGIDRMTKALREEGILIGRQKVSRLMKLLHLRAKAARKWKNTTDSNHRHPVAPNLLKQNFSVDKPNTAWVTDITYIWTAEGWIYLCIFLDLFSRKIVGWSTHTRLTTDLVTQSFERAVARRNPGKGLIVHSDRGCQYASKLFRNILHDRGFVQSMSGAGNCYDNAVAESFFHSLKVELIHGNVLDSRKAAEHTLWNYIERFYNSKRLHSTLGLMCPDCFEKTAVQNECLEANVTADVA